MLSETRKDSLVPGWVLAWDCGLGWVPGSGVSGGCSQTHRQGLQPGASESSSSQTQWHPLCKGQDKPPGTDDKVPCVCCWGDTASKCMCSAWVPARGGAESSGEGPGFMMPFTGQSVSPLFNNPRVLKNQWQRGRQVQLWSMDTKWKALGDSHREMTKVGAEASAQA